MTDERGTICSARPRTWADDNPRVTPPKQLAPDVGPWPLRQAAE